MPSWAFLTISWRQEPAVGTCRKRIREPMATEEKRKPNWKAKQVSQSITASSQSVLRIQADPAFSNADPAFNQAHPASSQADKILKQE